MAVSDYVSLLKRFPPRVIHDEDQLEATQRDIDELLGRKDDLDDAELAYLELLSTLVEDWEDEHVEIPAIAGVDLIKVVLEDRGLSQRDLVRANVFATDSVASEVLAGKRGLTVEHVSRLARFFDLPADLFLPTAPAVHSA
jgi:HTH-type transcriptional regulator/antitoxin HigA